MKQTTAGILCLLALLALSTGALASDDKQSLTAAEIISKHIAAVGGKEAVARLKTRVAIGIVRKFDEPEAKVYIVSEAPNRVSATYNFSKLDWRLSYDGVKAGFRPMLPADAASIQEKHRDMIASGLMFNGISLYNILVTGETDEVKFQARGTKKVKDRQAYVVEVKRKNQPTVRLFFDAETFMWVRSEYGRADITRLMAQGYREDHSEDESTVDFAFQTSGFREVDGVKLPFKFEQTVSAPMIRGKLFAVMTGTISEYKHNLPIDPKMFQ
jgi:hypothetical protein